MLTLFLHTEPRHAAATLVLATLLTLPIPLLADDTLAHGQRVYAARCYYCHGYDGTAQTVAASYLIPPPRDFMGPDARRLSLERIADAVRAGRPGTGMKSFEWVLSAEEIEAVAHFVFERFINGGGIEAGYHTEANGWQGDPYASPAAPFVSGEASIDTPVDALAGSLRTGRAIFLGACIACHDRGTSTDETVQWRNEAVTFPEGNYVEHDDLASRPATGVFEAHDAPPAPATPLTPLQQRGAGLYRDNCAACHAGDGSGRNWTGSFLEPPPPDFSRARSTPLAPLELREILLDGLAGTAMPAWRHVLDDSQIDAINDYLPAVFPRFNPPSSSRLEDRIPGIGNEERDPEPRGTDGPGHS